MMTRQQRELRLKAFLKNNHPDVALRKIEELGGSAMD